MIALVIILVLCVASPSSAAPKPQRKLGSEVIQLSSSQVLEPTALTQQGIVIAPRYTLILVHRPVCAGIDAS